MNHRFGAAALCLAALLAAQPARAAANLVVNGDFEAVTYTGTACTTSCEFGGRYSNVQVNGWTTNGYNFLFKPGQADTVGATGEYGNLKLWGPGQGVSNGLTATSPTGGNYVAGDGAFGTDGISQSIGGLTVGALYSLTFYWAAAQQQGFTGPTTENWTVSFGSQSFQTATVNTPSQGFSPWVQSVYTFQATAVTQTLSFLAAGTPSGVPPFSLLDGVSLTYAPEPATWAVLMVGLAGLWFAVSRRRGPSLAA